MLRACRPALQFVLAVYVGIGVAVALSAPQVFRTLESPEIAGTVFANILRATTRVDVVLGGAAIVLGAVCIALASRPVPRTVSAIAIALLVATIGYYRFSIMPRMFEHRSLFLEGSGTVSEQAAREHREAFDRLHHHYTRVYSGAMLLALCAFGCVSRLDGDRPVPGAIS